ncbi:MAG: GHKL domain-containing protein [bacterium]|nr:MAG: GHKL domain-containing protein [bacterium]
MVQVIKDFDDIPQINCYPNELNQVFMNLFANAAQAIENQETITLQPWADESNLCIEISNTGKGIATEHLERVFDPGFTAKGVGFGTGLGLSISYNIVQKHHGEITTECEVGKGTTFTIILPQK